MNKSFLLKFVLILFVVLFANLQQSFSKSEGELAAGMVNPGHEDKPTWFKVSFLDLFDDINEAADNNKRLMVYFYQDGCPY